MPILWLVMRRKRRFALLSSLVLFVRSGVVPPVQLVISRIGLCLCFFKGITFYLGFGVPVKPLVHECSSGASESEGEVGIIAHTDAIELTSLQAEQLVPRSKLWTAARPKTKGQPSSSSRPAPVSSSAPRATGLPILDFLRF